LDADKLLHDGLTLGDEVAFCSRLGRMRAGARVTVIDSTTKGDLSIRLAEALALNKSFDLIVAIGHSNDSGIRVASDLFVEWPVFAMFVKEFSPRILALVACSAGTRSTADALFSKIPSLDRIYSSPEPVTTNVAGLILVIAGYAWPVRIPDPGAVKILKAVSLLGTGRRLVEWKRRGTLRGREIWEDLLFATLPRHR
jgi:hypothetical protein